jgi:hypothetical protein
MATIGLDGPVVVAFSPPALMAGFPFRVLMMGKGPLIVLPSNRPWLSVLALAAFLFCGCGAAPAQQFSADLAIARDGGAAAPAGKVHVFSEKVRIETPEFAGGFFLIDGAKPAAFFVRPAAGIFMDARQSSRLTRILVQVDPGDPCRQWQAMASVAGVADQGDWRCERVGEETIEGHRAIAYRAVSASGQEIFGWIDPVHKFPLRIKTEDGAVITAQNVRDEPQPAQWFEIPPGLRKFDPQALIHQIKQSDVWVAHENDSQSPHP